MPLFWSLPLWNSFLDELPTVTRDDGIWHGRKGFFTARQSNLLNCSLFLFLFPLISPINTPPLPLYWICSAPSPLLVKTLSALHWVCSSLLEKQGTCRFASLFPLFSSLLPPPPTGLHVLPFSNMGSSPLSISMLLLHLGNALFSPFLSFSLPSLTNSSFIFCIVSWLHNTSFPT